jgi:hypothetical protein
MDMNTDIDNSPTPPPPPNTRILPVWLLIFFVLSLSFFLTVTHPTTCAHAHKYTHTYWHTYFVSSCTFFSNMQTQTPSWENTCTYMYIYTYTYTYVHTHIQICIYVHIHIK